MTVPGGIPGQKDDVVIVLMPHLLTQPPVISPPSEAGSAYPLVNQAGGAADVALVNPWLAGFLLLLLPLLSTLIWAFWRCKPGCCAFWIERSENIPAKDENLVKNLNRVSNSSKSYSEKGLLLDDKPEDHNEVSPTIDDAEYVLGQNKHLDIHDRYNLAIRNELPYVGGRNVYNVDRNVKVDCFVLSQNSKYVVTGSASGPPQIWDMQTGEPIKMMDGCDIRCSDIYLAYDDRLLIGQAVDDANSEEGFEMHRLELWDFETGTQLETPTEMMSSANCVTRNSLCFIVARMNVDGSSILVWNLATNRIEDEIFYNPLNEKSVVSFIKINQENRLVVAGFNNPDDDQAYYMVFDLAASFQGIYQPNFAVFNAEANATELLNNIEAVTGTRNGELIVWDLLTGHPLRNIGISAVLDGGEQAFMNAHAGTIHSVALSEDNCLLVTGSQDTSVCIFDLTQERLLHSLDGHSDDVLSVAISVDNEIVVSASWDGSIRVWRVLDGTQMCWFSSNIEVLRVRLSNDKRVIVGLGERNGHRKLIMMQIIRNSSYSTIVYPSGDLLPPTSLHSFPTNDVV